MRQDKDRLLRDIGELNRSLLLKVPTTMIAMAGLTTLQDAKLFEQRVELEKSALLPLLRLLLTISLQAEGRTGCRKPHSADE